MRNSTAKDCKIKLIQPPNCKISGVKVLEKTIHFDPRGFLVETLRADDKEIEGGKFVMTYTSATPAGVARDENCWHYHKNQVDRFVVPLGEVALALFDARNDSKTYRVLQILHLVGAEFSDFEKAKEKNLKFNLKTFIVTIPVGVYHCYKNIGKNLVMLQNFPTELYNPDDEGRMLFKNVSIEGLGGKPFSWDLLD